MEITYSDREIVKLIQKRKVLPNDWRHQLAKNGTVFVDGDDGNRFRIVAQQSDFNPLSFSAVLIVFLLTQIRIFYFAVTTGGAIDTKTESKETKSMDFTFTTQQSGIN